MTKEAYKSVRTNKSVYGSVIYIEVGRKFIVVLLTDSVFSMLPAVNLL